jgi:hypothetical protein
MIPLSKRLVLIILLLALAAPAWAKKPLPPPLPVEVAGQWIPVPGVQGVQYAPNLGLDFFQYGRGYYCLHQGQWYQTTSIQGSWMPTQSPPQVFYQIQAPYFKNPPGWAKGKKTGWGGAPMPPGQMKKYEQGPHIPPGQMKKMHQ